MTEHRITTERTASDDTAALRPAEPAPERTPVWGTGADLRGAARVLVGSSVATVAYAVLAARFTDYTPTGLEVVGTVTSLACVWTVRRQNVLCMPLGLVSVVAMGAFFFQIDLVGQGWLHLGYYVPIQIVGWWMWIRGGDRHSDKAVAWMTDGARLGVILAVAAGTLILATAFEHLHGPGEWLMWDSSIVAASVAAQALLTIKRIESWWVWLLPVDVSAILLYTITGAHLFAALYTLYLVLASLGLRDWTRAWYAQQQGLSPLQARLTT